MKREELLQLKEGTLITGTIENINGEKLIKVMKLTINEWNLSEKHIYLKGIDWLLEDIRLTTKEDIYHLKDQEFKRHLKAMETLNNYIKEIK